MHASSRAPGNAPTDMVNVSAAANVLISEDGSVQLCDFGVAAMLQTKDEKRQTILGTPNWMAPELHSRSTNVLYGKNVGRP